MTSESSIGMAQKIAFVTSLTEQSTTDLEGVGTTRQDQYGVKYRWVKNISDNAARAGAPACFDATNLAAANFLQECVTEDLSTGDVRYLAGIWMAAVAGGSYGWVTALGIYATARYASGTTATSAIAVVAGDMMIPGASTAVDGTGTNKPHCFVASVIATATVGSTAAFPYVMGLLFGGAYVEVLEASTASGSTATTADLTCAVYVKGFGMS